MEIYRLEYYRVTETHEGHRYTMKSTFFEAQSEDEAVEKAKRFVKDPPTGYGNDDLILLQIHCLARIDIPEKEITIRH